MKSVQQEVVLLLNRDVAVQKCLQKNLLNVRALAQYLIKEYDLNFSIDAVISAIRRYDAEVSEVKTEEKELKKVFLEMSIYTKDAVTRIVLKDKTFPIIAEDFLGKKRLRENFRLIKGKENVTLIVSQKDIEQKLSLFKSQDIILLQKNLSEIRMDFGKDVTKIKGLLSRLAGELTIRGINIEDIIFSSPDILLYIQEKYMIKALEAIKGMKE